MLKLSNRAETLLRQNAKDVQIIVEIEGLEDQAIFGATSIEKFARIGEDDLTIGEFFIGGTVSNSISKPYITTEGTSKTISQQIVPDSAVSSIQKLSVQFVDFNGEMLKFLQPGNFLEDPLGTKARVYIGFKQGAHPEDSVLILNGIIERTTYGAGFVKLEFAHPDTLRRKSIFPIYETELNGAIDNSVTTISLNDAAGLFLPEDMVRTFAIIEDEAIEYTGISGNDITGCVRGSILPSGTTNAASHGDDTDISSFFLVRENTIQMALKIMLSGPNKDFREAIEVKDFVELEFGLSKSNGISFTDDIQTKYGLVEGDRISITLSNEVGNNFQDRTIVSFGELSNGFFVEVSGAALIQDPDTPALASFGSQYNVLNQEGLGCEMDPEQVDVERFLFWDELFGPNYPEYEFEINETKQAKEFLDKQVFYPAATYFVPRKGKVSLNMNIPPLALDDVVLINSSNVRNADKLVIERSTNQFFYNAVEYNFGHRASDDLFFNRDLRISAESLSRFKSVGIKKLQIDSEGMRKDIDANQVVTSLSRRFLERYKFGATQIKQIKLLYETGFKLEVGDSIVLEGESLKLADINKGNRNFVPRLYEIINKKWDYVKGDISIDILDTAFDLNARVGVISASSFIGVGSTTTNIILAKGFGTSETKLERSKWEPYIGQTILVHDDDWTYQEETILIGFDLKNDNAVIVNPPLSNAPGDGDVFDTPKYSGDELTKAIYKNLHVFFCPVVDITSGIDNSSFTVAPADISKYFIGGFTRVNDTEFNVLSERLEIIDIQGNDITVDGDFGFTPLAGYESRPIGFSSDNGLPYNWL